jgi:hypothetical protein
MRALASIASFGVVLALATLALAQGTPVDTAKPDAPVHAETKESNDDRGSLDDDDEEPKTAAVTPAPSQETPRKREQKELPPPGDPRIDEQSPRPYLEVAPRKWHDRHVEIGPDVGVWARPAKGNEVTYSPGLAYGLHARADLLGFLGLRVYGASTKHPVSIPRGALGLPATEIHSSDLQVFQLGARLEPTFMPLPTLRVWLGLGAAWGRASADEPATSGANAVDFHDRAGVYVEYSGALGVTWDAIPDWLAVTLCASGGIMTDQSGDLFHDQQASRKDGTLTRIGAMPELESSFSTLLGVGIIL